MQLVQAMLLRFTVAQPPAERKTAITRSRKHKPQACLRTTLFERVIVRDIRAKPDTAIKSANTGRCGFRRPRITKELVEPPVVRVTGTVPLPFGSSLSVDGTEHFGPPAGVTAHVIVVNVTPAFEGPSEKLTATTADCPGPSVVLGGDVTVIVMETGVTGPARFVVLSLIVPVI